MNGDFWGQVGVMALTFGLVLVLGLFSRRMERSDYLTLIAIPIIAFPIAVLPGILTWGSTRTGPPTSWAPSSSSWLRR